VSSSDPPLIVGWVIIVSWYASFKYTSALQKLLVRPRLPRHAQELNAHTTQFDAGAVP
jgi:hypothetical protein